MIGYVTLGTDQYDEAAKFCDEPFTAIGEAFVIPHASAICMCEQGS